MNLTEFDSKLDMWNFESVDYSQRRKEESRDVILKALEMKEFEQSNIRRERNLKKSYNVDARLCINPVLPTKPKEFKPAPDFRFHDNRERLIEL